MSVSAVGAPTATAGRVSPFLNGGVRVPARSAFARVASKPTRNVTTAAAEVRSKSQTRRTRVRRTRKREQFRRDRDPNRGLSYTACEIIRRRVWAESDGTRRVFLGSRFLTIHTSHQAWRDGNVRVS